MTIEPQWLAIVISWLGLIIAFLQIRDIKKARKGVEAPFFELNHLLYEISGTLIWSPSHSVPSDFQDGKEVMISVHNKGGESRLTKIQCLTGIEMEMGRHNLIKGDKDLQIIYKFVNARRGQKERIKICYETISGEQGSQVFEHLHGTASFIRISK